MQTHFAADALLGSSFALRLDRLLRAARRSLQLEVVGVLELAALDGRIAPWWRGMVPTPEVPPSCALSVFQRLASAAAVASGGGVEAAGDVQLGEPFAGRSLRVCPLVVRPKIDGEADALLVFRPRSDARLDAEALCELQRCLEVGLSEDRENRLAHVVFQAVSQSPDVMELSDQEARLFYANPAWAEAFGYPVSDVVGRTAGELLRDSESPLHDSAFYQFTLATLQQGKPWLGSLACRHKEGKRVFVEVHVAPFTAADHGFQGNFAVRRDTAHRAERDRALAASHSEFRAVLSAVADGVVVLREGRIYFANAAFSNMVGHDESDVIGRSYVEFIHPDDRVQFVAESETRMTRVRILARDGSTRFAEISPGGAVSFEARPATILLSRDTTDYRVAQEELAHAKKLSALGSLAAGVAHEINNPLAYLKLNLEQLRSSASARGSEDAFAIDEALDGAERIRRIVTELHQFSASDGNGPAEAVDVAKAIGSATNIALNQIRHRAKLVRDHESGLFALAREGPLVQVLLNVLVNAAQAIPLQSDMQDHTIQVVSRRTSRGGVQILVSDTGVGIPARALPKVFEPFSSKPRGEGAGLGLVISKRIIDALGGNIRIRSQVGRGTTVEIELAAAPSPAEVVPLRRHQRPGPARHARVLIVDDENFLARGLRRALSPHETLSVGDGRAALALLRRDSNFDVVLCDLMMPGLSGAQLYEAACQLAPDLGERFIFMTGGAFLEDSQEFIQGVGLPVLQKPFDVARVLDWIDRITAKSSPSTED